MSFRTLNTTEKTNSNPATKFLEWKSEKKCFQYYDKEIAEKLKNEGKDKEYIKEKANIEVNLPLKFQFLEDFHTIKGFSDSEQTGIYSNEIKFTSKDSLTVKTFGGTTIAEGLYNDIRLKIIDAGGKYHKSIYAVLNGELVNFQIKGSVVSAFSLFANGQKKTPKQPFVQGHSNRFESHFIEINDFESLKKGATKYTVPNFTIGDAYTPEDLKTAKEKYLVISEYFKAYSNKDNTPLEEVEVDAELVDDLDF